jgi:hypothetical protein
VRDAVTPLRPRHAPRPQVGRFNHVVVNGYHAKSQCHGITLPIQQR